MPDDSTDTGGTVRPLSGFELTEGSESDDGDDSDDESKIVYGSGNSAIKGRLTISGGSCKPGAGSPYSGTSANDEDDESDDTGGVKELIKVKPTHKCSSCERAEELDNAPPKTTMSWCNRCEDVTDWEWLGWPDDGDSQSDSGKSLEAAVRDITKTI